MYVCICQGVTERQIHEAARNGAACLRDLRRQLGVTDGCGRCAVCAHACLSESRASRQGGKAGQAGDHAQGW
ncbi:MAG: (2Fe-2S)-binding protein [Azoarcus sp.]|jgi:bacterioferritin-associated ferredoxin|nr:(2Fe-2S)-binding protein [Azoarcus sp.]